MISVGDIDKFINNKRIYYMTEMARLQSDEISISSLAEYQRRKGEIDELLENGEITSSDHKLRCDILTHTKKMRDQPSRSVRETLEKIREQQIDPAIIAEARYRSEMDLAAQILDRYGEKELAGAVRNVLSNNEDGGV